MGEKGERLTGTIIKDTWAITRGGGKGVGGKGRKLYSNKNEKKILSAFSAF